MFLRMNALFAVHCGVRGPIQRYAFGGTSSNQRAGRLTLPAVLQSPPFRLHVGQDPETLDLSVVLEFRLIGEYIGEVLDGLAASNSGDNTAVEGLVRAKVAELCRRFPIYPGQ